MTPSPSTPFQHVVIIVKENHTFDNYFGTFPGAEGVTLCFDLTQMPLGPPSTVPV